MNGIMYLDRNMDEQIMNNQSNPITLQDIKDFANKNPSKEYFPSIIPSSNAEYEFLKKNTSSVSKPQRMDYV